MPVWKDATQTVFGEGPPEAEIMFVGEQPGDREDREGRPFVGPAGLSLDKALVEAGVDRSAFTLPTRSSISNLSNAANGGCTSVPTLAKSRSAGLAV